MALKKIVRPSLRHCAVSLSLIAAAFASYRTPFAALFIAQTQLESCVCVGAWNQAKEMPFEYRTPIHLSTPHTCLQWKPVAILDRLNMRPTSLRSSLNHSTILPIAVQTNH